MRLFLSRISWLGLLSVDGEKLVAFTIVVQKFAASFCNAGFEATEYELTTRTYLALFLDSTSIEDLLNRMDEDVAFEILAAMAKLR